MKKSILIALSFLMFSCATHDSSFNDVQSSFEKRDYNRAFEELQKANKADPRVQYALGYMYYNGLGCAKDQDLGRYWIHRAALNHYHPAFVALYRIIHDGEDQYIPLSKNRKSKHMYRSRYL